MLQALCDVRLAQPLQGEVQGGGGDEGIILNLLSSLQGHNLLLLVNVGHLIVWAIPLHTYIAPLYCYKGDAY